MTQNRLTRPLSRAALLAPLLLVLHLLTGCTSAAAPAETASGGAAPPWPTALDHPSTPETHRRAVGELFTAMQIDRVLALSIDNAMKVQMTANPKLAPFEKVMRRFLDKYMSLEAIREPLTDSYAARFSELEIVQLTAFYRTPLGQRTLIELPKIMEDGSKLGLRSVQEHMEELKDMIREEVERGGAGPAE